MITLQDTSPKLAWNHPHFSGRVALLRFRPDPQDKEYTPSRPFPAIPLLTSDRKRPTMFMNVCLICVPCMEVNVVPRGDGTGPAGQSPGTAQGFGRGLRRGMGRTGRPRPAAGPVGECVCPVCGAVVPHQRGIPCYQMTCPQCGSAMTRK